MAAKPSIIKIHILQNANHYTSDFFYGAEALVNKPLKYGG